MSKMEASGVPAGVPALLPTRCGDWESIISATDHAILVHRALLMPLAKKAFKTRPHPRQRQNPS